MRITEVETSEKVMETLQKEFSNITEIKRIFKIGSNPISVVYNDGKRVAFVESDGKGFVIHYID